MAPPDPDALDVFAWNPHTGRPWAQLQDVLDDQLTPERFDVAVLTEVARHHDELAEWGKANGYHVHQEQPLSPKVRPKPSHGTTALLVTRRASRDLEVLSHRVVAMRKRWTVFSHDTRRAPRRYERVRLQSPDGRWKVTASHWPTNGFTGGNRVAFAESAARAAAALRARGRRTVAVDVGDHNESVSRLRVWARLFRGAVEGHGPDSCVVVGGDVDARRLPKWGSDHHAMRYRITR